MEEQRISQYECAQDDMHILLKYSDVFNGPVPDLGLEIPRLNMHKAISVVTELIRIINKDMLATKIFNTEIWLPAETFVKVRFLGIKLDNRTNIRDFPILKKDCHIISLQALLLLLKRIIAHGNYDTMQKTDYCITDTDFTFIIQLQLALVEDIYKKDENEFDAGHFIYGNYHLNNRANVANRFLRMNFMLEYLCRDRTKFAKDIIGEYRDYYTDFWKKYGISTTQYSYLLFWELRPYYADFDGSLTYSSRWRCIEKIYAGSKNQELLHKALAPVSSQVSDLKQWAIESENQLWDFTGFLAYPFLRDNSEQYISISEYSLSNGFFGKLFWLIRDCYPREDSRAMAFYGRLYEKYIQTITEKATSGKYKLIGEFEIPLKSRGNPKSSDVYLQSGTLLLAVEAKGFMDLIDVMSKNENIGKNNRRLFINPILQADAFASTAINEGFAFKEITEIYVLSVTMENINANPVYYTEIIDTIEKEKKCNQVKFYFNFNIEEYELLMYLVETGEDIFAILKDYFQEKQLTPFGNYARLHFPDIKMTSFMKKYYDNACKEMVSFISGNESDS